MRIAFYAPLKPPDHPVPSGDRRVARQIVDALRLAGHEVEIASRLRSYEPAGDTDRQIRLAALGGRLAGRFIHRVHNRPLAEQPQAWLTYHLYYKAPDWIGPRIITRLGIPYIVVEASVADKRAGGPWSLGHQAVIAALNRASAVISLNPADEPGVAPHVSDRSRLHRLKPFLDARPYAAAAAHRDEHRRALAERFALDPTRPWCIAVAMMRPGDKLESYKVLAEAFAKLSDEPWSLILVGDGPARAQVETAFAPLAGRVISAGAMAEDTLPALYAAGDLYVWPAVNEAFGMAILEAHAAGLPVVAGDSGGVGEIVAHGRTGLLVPPRDAEALAAAIRPLLADASRRRRWAADALAKVAAEHDVRTASRQIDDVLTRAQPVLVRT
jgi:glycosyltransferase involved in cell wall biosynthesis